MVIHIYIKSFYILKTLDIIESVSQRKDDVQIESFEEHHPVQPHHI